MAFTAIARQLTLLSLYFLRHLVDFKYQNVPCVPAAPPACALCWDVGCRGAVLRWGAAGKGQLLQPQQWPPVS